MSITVTRTARRAAATLAVAGALTLAAPAVAQAAPLGPLVLPPGSTVCTKAPATNGAHAGGTATAQGATFSVFRNGNVISISTPNTVGFDRDFTGGGNYKLCATNTNSQNTKVTLDLSTY